ncbi:DUF1579 domain-containing protein [Myxococcus sp. SDU36]|uniref:DUF1579 domain-containing protein n=1 Tax=Myxococcus sp. SDU36 TaxID=2831967 RepID=UPI002543A86A|nr:DUF1579 domain-containing protein [Myxococcus sp. SDU36]WIG92919.1 DUF1579 domain-containing protein [Myxococcus sp. SDU36]
MFIRPSAFMFVAIAGLLGCRGSASKWPEDPTAVPMGGQAPAAAPSAVAAEASTSTVESARVDSAKALAGTWTCTGSVHGPGGASPSEVTLDVRPDLDKTWLRTDFAVLSGEYKYKFTSYRTFDAASSKWVNVIVDNLGGHAKALSTDGITWLGESSGPMGEMRIRDTEHVVSPGMMNMRGQYSLDGRTWNTGYDLSCKK